MKLLHSSDWHLGRTLYAKKERTDEHVAFLQWLLATIKENAIDVLLVAGDVFDTASPGSGSQKLYYDFLLNVRHSGCQHVIVIGGNHDSPGFLNAPKEILAALNVCVAGNAGENAEDEVVVLKNGDNDPIAVVCAVPFLRERDISRFTEGETYSDRSKRIAENIKKHYEKVAQIAESKLKNINKKIPVIATGHLAVTGGKTVEDDGVRETYIGNVECIGSETFLPLFDYVALGHYHIASVIDKTIRYCGSPIPMGFGEANQKKCVYMVDFSGKTDDVAKGDFFEKAGTAKDTPTITSLEIPIFQKLESIQGDKAYINNRIAALKQSDSSVWVEIVYTGDEVFPDFTAWANEAVANTKIEIIKLQNRQYLREVLTQDDNTLSLNELDKYEVFNKLLEKNNISDGQKEELKNSYREIIVELSLEN